MMAMRIPAALRKPRPTTCSPTSTVRPGARALTTLRMQPAAMAKIVTERRPRRSATATTPRATTTSARTAARARLSLDAEKPSCSRANSIV
jgi:hypothetical protein